MAKTITRIPISLTDPTYFCNKSWTLSYHVNAKAWISFHSYIPNFYIAENNFFYSGKNGCCDDFDFIVGIIDNSINCDLVIGKCIKIEPPPTTTTTSTSTSSTSSTSSSTTTTTTTTEVPVCFVEGYMEVLPDTTTTTTTTSTSTSTTTTTLTTCPPVYDPIQIDYYINSSCGQYYFATTYEEALEAYNDWINPLCVGFTQVQKFMAGTQIRYESLTIGKQGYSFVNACEIDVNTGWFLVNPLVDTLIVHIIHGVIIDIINPAL